MQNNNSQNSVADVSVPHALSLPPNLISTITDINYVLDEHDYRNSTTQCCVVLRIVKTLTKKQHQTITIPEIHAMCIDGEYPLSLETIDEALYTLYRHGLVARNCDSHGNFKGVSYVFTVLL